MRLITYIATAFVKLNKTSLHQRESCHYQINSKPSKGKGPLPDIYYKPSKGKGPPPDKFHKPSKGRGPPPDTINHQRERDLHLINTITIKGKGTSDIYHKPSKGNGSLQDKYHKPSKGKGPDSWAEGHSLIANQL